MRDAVDRIPRVPDRGHENEVARQRRMEWIREETGKPLQSLGRFDLNPARLVGNIENLVGSVEIPVGLAGPLLFQGEHAVGWITAPFATTEGALVASATRGAHAVSRCGGTATRVLGQRMVRAPRFDLDDVVAAQRFGRWAVAHQDTIAALITDVSSHAKLIDLEPVQIGRSVDLLFVYETGDASGQNMTTACTWRACQWIDDQLRGDPRIGLRSYFVEGNAAGDKKLSQRSLVNGRGTRVTAECFVDGATLERVLKVSQADIIRAFDMGVVGSALSGSVSSNINVANAVAALFAATGQDIACVHESGVGILAIEADGDGIYASMLLPCLAVGTVGGGTHLPQQANYLEMIGCGGTGTAGRLAEVIAGFSLALDLSTLAAVSGGQFATAHERLGRNRPVRWFTEMDLTADFFAPMIAASGTGRSPEAAIEAVKIVGSATEASVISELTHRVSTQKLVGVIAVDIHLVDDPDPLEVMVKSKPLDDEIILAAQRLVSIAGGSLAQEWAGGTDAGGFLGTHLRELELYRNPGPLRRIMPVCYGIHQVAEREAYLLVLERLGDDVILKDSADRPQDWSAEYVDTALRGIATVHGHWYGKADELFAEPCLGPSTAAPRLVAMRELWRGLFEHHRREHPGVITASWLQSIQERIDSIGDWWSEIESMPRTLVHNDFNSRNIALRKPDHRSETHELVAYDWELATVHLPQRDLAELLSYVLTPDVSRATVDRHVECHRLAVQDAAGVDVDPVVWRRGYRLALIDFVIRRLSLYLLVHSEHRLTFVERVLATAKHLDELEQQVP
ncbi:hydroxymethylglutaryl-CoA reductase (NADPH) [Rhodococcus sp. 27YEA15]|uniref:hypothetical protein n=1 Tax=Rhodococcus sp. 27YEA15 TaxID=3156259 RepID=UPI003C79A6EE